MIKLRVDDETAIPLSVDSSSAVSMTVSEAFIDRGGSAIQNNKNATPSTSQVVVTPDQGYDAMEKVTVAAIPPEYIIPSGTKSITANGTHDVTDYASASVAVPASAVDSGTKSITANGNGQDVVGYAAVNVNVPNTYAAGDEGKVVSNGALVSQSSATYTENGTYDTTTKNEVVVDVQSGGGGGATVIASGTWMGDATNNIQVAVGKKMANTNFVFIVWLDNGVTIDASDGAWRKPVRCGYAISKRWGHFDLSSDGTKTQLSDVSFVADDQSGTVNTRTPNYCLGTQIYSRKPTLDAQEGWCSVSQAKIIRDSSGFSLRFERGGGYQYKYMTTTYNWEVIYFGDDPTNDIVEVS